jgi:hypothetical protein
MACKQTKRYDLALLILTDVGDVDCYELSYSRILSIILVLHIHLVPTARIVSLSFTASGSRVARIAKYYVYLLPYLIQ